MSTFDAILPFYVDTLGSHIVHQVPDDVDDDVVHQVVDDVVDDVGDDVHQVFFALNVKVYHTLGRKYHQLCWYLKLKKNENI